MGSETALWPMLTVTVDPNNAKAALAAQPRPGTKPIIAATDRVTFAAAVIRKETALASFHAASAAGTAAPFESTAPHPLTLPAALPPIGGAMSIASAPFAIGFIVVLPRY